MVQVKKMVYRFQEGDATMRDLLGGKGAGLSEMARIGLPVPPGFVITTEACLDYFNSGGKWPQGLWEDVQEHMKDLEATIGRHFGSHQDPLLVSVRSGAKISMPGMMDTILNLGINDDIVVGVALLMGDERPAFDAYRRLLQKYAEVVMEVDAQVFEDILQEHKERAGVKLDHQLSPAALKALIADFKAAIREKTGTHVPEDPREQLHAAVEAVFKSWNNPRATYYRNYHGIPHNMGTAVTIMAMVFGNVGDDSGTGVLFTRNPATGARELYGEYLANAQGEDVVAGIRTPEDVGQLQGSNPSLYQQIAEVAERLEKHYQDVQDVEFTVEHEKLYILQTRSAKRNALAATKTAVDMVNEGLISREEALTRVPANDLTQLFVPRFDLKARDQAVSEGRLLARGFGASPGAATGKAIFDATRAAEAAQNGEKVILVRPETNPDDVHGILNATGILTSRGGVTSHAALVTRGLGKPCIVGCEDLRVDAQARSFQSNGIPVREGDDLSIDGTTGEVLLGHVDTVYPSLEEMEETRSLLAWADEVRRLGVWANADTEADAKRASDMGAEGIGLCRTEHMFLGPERVPTVQQMLLNAAAAHEWQKNQASDTPKGDKPPAQVRLFNEALERLEQLQTEDFTAILRVMGERPVIIRLLDAPLHEFLPQYDRLLRELMELKLEKAPKEDIAKRESLLQVVEGMREVNPMLGHRGCRVGITFPAIYEMQVRAILTASCDLVSQGIQVHPEIMIPLTSHVNELRTLRENLAVVAAEVQKRMGVKINYLFGTMIEVPRAALTAAEIAKEAQFFSFGTNDLTQTTFGFSRDDAEGKFLKEYLQEEILPENPFAVLDRDGVGALIRTAVEEGRRTSHDLEVGICGEHGGDPSSIAFCHQMGLDYVSCSPFRVPVARLAAAQAALGVIN